ncbi:AraC family transcriptional regulator [Alkaliphilus peptidifermentans]|uniref:AraC family transcriptional regulator n=1 Tax=Alkaliphilus peptidifermentans DSM 18978 TaxID=1120976 RepID=A0A1G5G2V4_9FIRM|nr:AraC family transcriptional regulator [Alkaliphilus peptidifermentans]SCY45862.1 AraC family transcriptional regulator [Alkaliphilus peptidifermentans DSM 18978]
MELIFNESRQIYISKINAVQDYIEKHLEDELHIEQLANIACFSVFHFQRIYHQITGESLYSFIKRLRLEKAAFLIRSNRSLPILDIALTVGFSNQASFAKAFKERYGINASQIRKLNDLDLIKVNYSTNGKVFYEKEHYNIPIDLSIRSKEPTKVIYIRHIGSYKGDSHLFMGMFSKLYDYASSQNLIEKESAWFAAYHDYGDLTMENKLRVSVCMSIAEDVAGVGEFGSMHLEGGKYAVGKFLLKKDEYQGAWNYMFSKWLPESGYIPDDRICFEHYPLEGFIEGKEGRVVEIFIPIAPLK